MFSNVGKKFAGLTDNPHDQKTEHGDPTDWSECRFDTEIEAQVWFRLLVIRGYLGWLDATGWRFGYTFTCTDTTIE